MPTQFFATEQAAHSRLATAPAGSAITSKLLPDGRTIWGVVFPDVPEPTRGDVFKRMQAWDRLK